MNCSSVLLKYAKYFDQVFYTAGFDATDSRPCFDSEVKIKAVNNRGLVCSFCFIFVLSCDIAVLVKELVMNHIINALLCVIPFLTFTQLPATERNKKWE